MRTLSICPDCIEEFTVIHEEKEDLKVTFCPFCSFEMDQEDDLFSDDEDE